MRNTRCENKEGEEVIVEERGYGILNKNFKRMDRRSNKVVLRLSFFFFLYEKDFLIIREYRGINLSGKKKTFGINNFTLYFCLLV